MALLTVVLVRSPHLPDHSFPPQFPAHAERRAYALADLHRTGSLPCTIEREGQTLRVLASGYYAGRKAAP